MTGLPLGTVKTICHRSGAFHDNARHRELFTLPPVRASAQTLPANVELPPQLQVTGDLEIDAVLWLREVIDTGQSGMIAHALEAAKRIKTPPKDLEKRYTRFLQAANPDNMLAALGSFGFADLEDLAKKTIAREGLRAEAKARFGDGLFDNTDAEEFCVEALAELDATGAYGEYDTAEAEAAFLQRADLAPNTLSDCLHELNYWDVLYRLRHAVDRYCGDGLLETRAREQFVFGQLARKRSRAKSEAVEVFRYLVDAERMDQSETKAILLNLIG